MTKANTVDEILIKLKEICDMAEVVQLKYHGRPDCKNCSLLETIREEFKL